jgi:hypothetical protein
MAPTQASPPYWPPPADDPRVDGKSGGGGWGSSQVTGALPGKPDLGRKRKGGVLGKAVAAVVGTAMVLAAGRVGYQQWLNRQTKPQPLLHPRSRLAATLAWSVVDGTNVFETVVALSPGHRPVAVVVPATTEIDLPDGPATAGQVGTAGPRLVEATQAALGRRMVHYLISESADVEALIDRLGGAEIILGDPFSWSGGTYGPGSVRLSGAGALAYLDQGGDSDRTRRWEEVLDGILSTSAAPDRWEGPIGQADDPAAVTVFLARAYGATVVELPTTSGFDEALRPDSKGVATLVRTRFGAAGSGLVRVVVLNGNGRAGYGGKLGTLLAPAGFRVVAAQNASSFGHKETQVIASDDRFLPEADRVLALIGTGKVYVGAQPTGIADITIVVGKDMQLG